MTSHPDQQLTSQIEALALAPGPLERDRHLLEAAAIASGAAGVSLWRHVEGAWVQLAGRGVAGETPGADQIQAVVAGQLTPVLPPGRVVSSRGPYAITTCSLPVDADPEEVLDRLDALLLTAALSVDSCPALELVDLIQPALASQDETGLEGPPLPWGDELPKLEQEPPPEPPIGRPS